MLKYNRTHASGYLSLSLSLCLSSLRLPGLISLIVSLKGCEVCRLESLQGAKATTWKIKD